jgi:hypothetical protein
MRTVPDFVPQCSGRLEAPLTLRSNECGNTMHLKRILVLDGAGRGVEPPRSCLRRILSFLRRLYVIESKANDTVIERKPK